METSYDKHDESINILKTRLRQKPKFRQLKHNVQN